MHRLADFYEGKTIFLTGASGYLGAILLETLLRCFPGIRAIYVLIREKRGVSPESRKEKVFERRIFGSLRDQNPEALKKIHVVAGNVTLPNLGMSDEDVQLIAKEATLVFHIAACISFIKPLRFMLTQNSKALDFVIDFCRKLKHIDALVYTSTAYSNCNRKEIEEQIYRLPFPAQRFLDALESEDDADLNHLHAQCQPTWPNNYTFSKCLAENILLEKAGDLPVAVVRPSIIVSCWKGPLPGYVEEGSGIVDLALAVGKGVVRVVHGNPNVRLDVVPVDVVANAHVAVAGRVAESSPGSPLVLNCISGKAEITFANYCYTLLQMTFDRPLPKSFQNPTVSIQSNAFVYRTRTLFEHYAPAVVLDTYLYLSGKKPKLMNVYETYEKVMSALYFFVTHQWKWHTDNISDLYSRMTPEDKTMLPLDMSGFSVDAMAETLPTGAPFYQWEIDTKASGERGKIAQRHSVVTACISIASITAFVSASYALLSFITFKGLSGMSSIFMIS